MTHGVECNYRPPSSGGVLHKPRIDIVPDPFLVKAVWLRETNEVDGEDDSSGQLGNSDGEHGRDDSK